MPVQQTLATTGTGLLNFIPGISFYIPGYENFQFYALPNVEESKEAQYSDIPIQGRSNPVTTFSHSNYRRFNITFHLHSLSERMMQQNVRMIRGVASLVHPEYNNTYQPPRLCYFKCGALIGGAKGSVRCLVDSYSFPMDPDVPWLGADLIPLYVALQISARVAYSFTALPGADDVLGGNY